MYVRVRNLYFRRLVVLSNLLALSSDVVASQFVFGTCEMYYACAKI
jgi:hypothetical protein